MSALERNIITIAVLLTLLWGAPLVMYYLVTNSGAPSHSSLEDPDMVTGNAAVTGPSLMRTPLPSSGALVFPTAAVAVPSQSDLDARRKRMMAAGAQSRINRGIRWAFQSRYEDRTGTILAPTTAPSTQPTLISVHLTKASLRQALVAVANAAKMKIAISPPGWLDSDENPTIDLNADNTPLMEVVNEICCKSAIDLYASGRGMWGDGSTIPADPATPVLNLQHQQADLSLGPWVISGPFSFEAEQVVHNASLQADAGSAMAMVTLKATHEPSIVVMAQGQQPKLTVAVDEQGHSLVSDASQVMVRPRQSFSWGRLLARAVGATEPAPDPSEFWTSEENGINIQLQCPPDFGHTIAKLEGTERFLIQRRAARLELPIASSPVDQDKTIGGVSITIGGWQVFSPQQQMFRVTIHRTHQDQTQWNRLSASVGALNPVLLDAAGEPLPELRHMGSNAGDPDCFCQFMCIQNNYEGGQFRGRTPVKLVMDVPTEFVAIDVPFKFENLPLP